MSMLITTSWDDGYARDLRVADALSKHNLLGTFYACPKGQHERSMLQREELASLAQEHEIGAHTLSHLRLTRQTDAIVQAEITGSKAWVEDRTGKPCTAFCYPKGDHDERVRAAVRNAGFTCARTCTALRFDAEDAFTLPISTQIFPFPWRRTFRPAWKLLDPLGPLRVQAGRLRSMGIRWGDMRSWRRLAEALLEYAVRTQQPYFHLYGHSHEIERFQMWNDLSGFLVSLSAVGGRAVTNSQLAAALRLT